MNDSEKEKEKPDEYCGGCGMPIFAGEGRYRISGVTLCETCKQEQTKKEKNK